MHQSLDPILEIIDEVRHIGQSGVGTAAGIDTE